MIHLRRNPTFDTVYWYFLPVAAFCALLLTAIALVAAGRNVGSDESYYLMMIRSGEPMMITKYNMYLQPIRNWDVPCFRYLALAVMAASSLIFAAGTNRFFKGSFTDGALLFFLNLAGPLLLVLPVNLTISYISMNLAVFNVSLGLMLWATAVKSRPASLAAAFTAGAAAIQLVFIQPVNLPFIGL